jgi:hypothetical protein
MQEIWMGTPVRSALQHDGLDAFVAVGCDAASVHGSASVNDRNLISAAVSQNLDAVSGLVVVQFADASFYVARVEKFHNLYPELAVQI